MQERKSFLIENPATLEILQALKADDFDAVDRKIEGANTAFESWSKTPVKGRRNALGQISVALLDEKEKIARILTQEQGKPLPESRAEVGAAAAVFKMYADLNFPEPEIMRDDDNARVTASQHPRGACAVILPWNYPVGLLSWKLAPALLAGNTAIIKPSEHAPLAVGRCLEIVSRILPKNVAEVIIGGASAGEYLAKHPDITKISFTGSQSTGREILRSASSNLTRASLELGGNDAAIILPDCDLKKRLDGIFWGAFRNAGQICIAIKRLYVHESRIDELTNMLAARADALKLGNGLDDGVMMGPLCNSQQLTRARALLDGSKAGEIMNAGAPIPETGHFMSPTIFRTDDDAAPIVADEQFSPILPVLAYSDVNDAVARANETAYGLGGSVWSENQEKAREVAGGLQCGTVWLNAHMLVEHGAPFGGWKHSGFGRELGRPGLMEFMQSQTVYENKN